eukprot:CAMPEP_0197683568 /NCGR_PEP_ID=MMETSP1338-20131121/98167_1 /TAXON_ID=43686 ORGANISM="Pelagodinium beii, Strain RCC1491" /NCGR_SAMPLE_ID=MMETSP1338 /ASSEMBLY_ACC=CAM_ASM_000754 /LENGTH=106 /DNA_ID=CAMNT_0043265175 /DNA_START=82 /DNA_END=402 /DNA_ORIENTATION=+
MSFRRSSSSSVSSWTGGDLAPEELEASASASSALQSSNSSSHSSKGSLRFLRLERARLQIQVKCMRFAATPATKAASQLGWISQAQARSPQAWVRFEADCHIELLR